ncbi:MAG: nickel pincer cofactor biosynthesis protein LarC [Acidobacteriota bacterium]|nr:nickel pincer cofactor biosynthesis protein LarC [Candidatus Aminicenantes bacterium]
MTRSDKKPDWNKDKNMNDLYLDASSGLSGDMLLGSLLDLGADRNAFMQMIASIGLPVELSVHETRRSSLRGLKVDVHITASDGKTRHFADIARFIASSPLSDRVRERGTAVFRRLFEAEAVVHGHPFDKTHLHEAGADDALVDILGTAWLLDALEVKKVFCSPLNVGAGWVKTSHGVLPVPPPAVAELLRNVPVYSAHVTEELVTPTGAALVSVLAEEFIPFPEITYDRIGCGAGGRDFPGFPNILRAFLGRTGSFKKDETVYKIEAAIDDSTPQILAAAVDRILEMGALDVTQAPLVMKKNRMGTLLTILSRSPQLDALIEAVFNETTSIGVRYYPVNRRVLERSIQTVEVLGETIRIKTALRDGRTINAQPEYEDCLKAARRTGTPLKDIIRAVESLFSI